jgi:transposase
LPVGFGKLVTGRKAKLTDIHSQFLVEFIDEHPAAELSDIRQNLCEPFPGLSLSISAFHRHLVQKCKVTLKKAPKIAGCKE